MRLTATDHSLEVVTSAAQSLGWHAVYNTLTATDAAAQDGQGNIATAATTTIVPAPAGSEQRDILNLILRNAGTAPNVITIQKNAGGTVTSLFQASLAAGETVQFSPARGFSVLDAQGREKQVQADNTPITARSAFFIKPSTTAPEGAGIRYWPAKDAGAPGPWAPGAPGLAGRAVIGTDAADTGCFPLWTPTGGLWLRRFTWNSNQLVSAELIDLLFVNTGIVVTTTAAQTLNTVTLPARDANGSTSGEGVIAGLLVTTATTNGGAIGTITLTYTNSDGTAGRTATMASFPATAVIGSFIPFDLQPGDKGIRSVQSITLGTTLVAGAVSLVLFRPIEMAQMSVAYGGITVPAAGNGFIRLWTGAALFPVIYPSGASAAVVSSAITVEER